MLRFLLSLLFLLTEEVFASPPLTSPLGPVIDLGYAAFVGNTTTPTGIRNGPVTSFGAVPYAQPPIGDLRFRAPRMLDESKKARTITDSRNWGLPCVQSPATVGVGSEDCLNLNIWKPTNATEKSKLPVVVFMHGGGFIQGNPRSFPFNDWVVQHPGGIVGVSITYRLTMLGFLGGSAVAADGDLNAGLLDQRAGLEWVQRHIAKFGGDPDNVTIEGESAGGASVVMQVVARGGAQKAPFKRAIAESIGYGGVRTSEQGDATFKSVTTALRCGESTMACVRNATTAQLVDVINSVGGFSPQVEGPNGFLPDLPSRLLAQGKFSNVEFIGGHCTGDGKTFAGGTPDQFVTDDDIRRLLFAGRPLVTNATIDKALALYPEPGAPGSPFATQWDRASTMAGEIVFACMDWFMAEQLKVLKGQKNLFTFSWDAPDTVLFEQKPYQGAMHVSDLYFLFDGTNYVDNAGISFTPFNSSEAALSREAIAYWTSFIAAGNPSTTKLATSPAWGGFVAADGGRQRMLFDRGGDVKTNSTMQKVTEAEIERCKFWMSEEVTAQTRL